MAKRRTLSELGYESYDAYLRSAHWKRVKIAYFRKHPRCCTNCGLDDEPIHLHHKTYHRIGHERLADLVALCQKCHAHVHKMGKKIGKNKDKDGKGQEKIKRLMEKLPHKATLNELRHLCELTNSTWYQPENEWDARHHRNLLRRLYKRQYGEKYVKGKASKSAAQTAQRRIPRATGQTLADLRERVETGSGYEHLSP